MDNRSKRFWAVLAASFATLAAVAFFMEGGRMNTRRDFVRGLSGLGAIVATGHAPAIVKSMIAARGTMLGGKKAPTAKDYVQDGLIAMWDGIENAGWGLIGNRELTYTQGTIINPDNAQCTSYSSSIAYRSGNIPAVTMEFVFKLDDAQTSASCFVLINRQDAVRYNGQFCLNYGYFGNLYFETLGNIQRCGVPFDIADRSIHSISASWGNGNSARATSGNIDGVSRLVTNLAGTGRDGDVNFIVGGLAPFQPYVYGMKGRVYSIRLYSRALTADEIAANYAVDKKRFNLAS